MKDHAHHCDSMRLTWDELLLCVEAFGFAIQRSEVVHDCQYTPDSAEAMTSEHYKAGFFVAVRL